MNQQLTLQTFQMTSGRIKLINCDQKILELILDGNDAIRKALNIHVPDKWTEFGDVIFKYSLEKIVADAASVIWWAYLPIHIESNTLIGSCGYKGPPNTNGMVEIGYEIVEAYRNQGYATELAHMLIGNAFNNPQVIKLQAHTLAIENASVKVLKKCGFVFVEELEDKEDGTILKWILERRD